jgi:GMP synthase (glutamine-hydrolysing)
MQFSKPVAGSQRHGAAVSQSSDGRRETILVLDFGGQYCDLIARAVREQNVYSEIVDCGTTPEQIRELGRRLNVKGIVLSGGPESVYSEKAPPFDKGILGLGVPVLGICYGHQLLARIEGGRVEASVKKEYGDATATIDAPGTLLRGLEEKTKVWMSHGDTVFGMPSGYTVLAHTENTPVAAFEHVNDGQQVFGLQWHPEVIHTEKGELVIRNFVRDICNCGQNWRMGNFVDGALSEIREKAQGRKGVVALSGGVDSSVTAALAGIALGHDLIIVYVDNGLMRDGETEQVRDTFSRLGVDLRIIDARKRFIGALNGVVDPKRKRKIIGNMFIRVFEEAAREIDADILFQGTIYADRIESGVIGRSSEIKAHHNVGGLPKDMKFKEIIEPLRDLYKDEVREVGAALGLPAAIVNRQPFPGPGLAIRVKIPITEQSIEIVRKADHIVTTEMEKAGLAELPWQYFAVLTNTKAVGVRGDVGSYKYVVAIRAVESRDGMTARFSELPWDALRKMSTRITNEIPEVARVTYDITDKPPGTVEWE